ncbi:MAG TPA: helix-turn-helix domain-containing protein [Nocardioidaceae bacterium]
MENIPGNIGRLGYGPRPTAPVRGRPLSPARTTVLEAVHDADGPTTLAGLAEVTGLHPNTLREHLEALTARRLVRRTRSVPSGRGRPAWLYAPAEPDPQATGSEYAGLAATLAAHIHRTSSDPRGDAVVAGRTWGRDLARRAGPPDGSGQVDARRKVADLLDEVGFCPESDERATTARLTRCPLLETAKEYPDVVCGVHLGIVQGALEEYGADSSRTALHPFSEPGACRLELLTPKARP